MTSLQPTSVTERHILLDVLRGFALLGVLLANMASHGGFFFLSNEAREAMPTAHYDHIAEWLEAFLIDGKFYSLFSMLFGIGFALQMKRASALDVNFTARFVRRLTIMFIIGLLHAILLYLGDILTVYALLGFVLLLFRNASDRALLRTAVALMILPIIQYAIFWGLHLANPVEPVAENGPRFFDYLISVYQKGTYSEIVQLNMGGLVLGRYPDLLFTGRFFRVLAMFIIGFYVARNAIFADVAGNRAFIRKVMIWGAVIGIPSNIILATVMSTNAYYDLEPLGIVQPLVYAFGVPALCFFYAAGIALLFQNPAWKKRLMIFAPVGQTALTNYLMQSLICVFIFMGYGLGYEAKIGPAYLTLIGLTIYAAQLAISHVWVKHFRFGPMEWVWRSLTYGKRQPMRR